MTNYDALTKTFLLVCCEGEDLIQKVLGLAIQADAIAYGYDGQNDAFVFDKTRGNIEGFEQMLTDLNVATATINYSL